VVTSGHVSIVRVTETAVGPVYKCPVDAPLQVLGGKWKLILCWYLLQQPRRNGELRRLVPGIGQKVLTQQLRELERDGVVRRTAYDELPAKVIYSIVETERDALAVVVDVMCDWGFDRVERHGGTILSGTRATSRTRSAHAS
jgi:DNA-binding HxlR family transcriptional regulator